MRTEKEIFLDIEQLNNQLKILQRELENIKAKSRNASSDSYKKRKEMLDSAADIFAKILKPGDFVKVTGSRAGSFREVQEISSSTLIGATCNFSNRTQSITRVNKFDIITCGTNKITAVLRDGKWVTAREILSCEAYNEM
jgi:hypothetical protein